MSLPARSSLHQVVFRGAVSCLWFDMMICLSTHAQTEIHGGGPVVPSVISARQQLTPTI